MKEPPFLTLAEALALHARMIETFGGDTGVRDLGLLESALAMPQAGFGGERFHGSSYEMAAAYAFHIAENQPFVDGNKRTALGCALTFLQLNGITLKDPRGLLYQSMIKIGIRQMTKQQLAELFKELAKK